MIYNKTIKTISTAFLLVGLVLLAYACGTARRMNKIDKERKEIPVANVTPAKIEDIANEMNPRARKVAALSTLELTSLQPIEKGVASWYGSDFHGQLTANGEIYDMHTLTAAHRTLPFNTIVLVKNMDNGKTVVVRVNDRGPFVNNRVIDLSKKAARKLGMIHNGTAKVQLFTLEGALPESSVENIKTATYTIQLGSYETEQQAFEHAARIPGARVEIAFIDNTKAFRVYYGLYINKEKASAVRKKLAGRSIEGYVKQVENG